MLICDEAYMDGRNIKCKVSGITCAHIRYCGLTMKWHQTDGAYDCPGREQNGQRDKTGEEHTSAV